MIDKKTEQPVSATLDQVFFFFKRMFMLHLQYEAALNNLS